jgi:two-component system, chemotaxis family, CheB/CheR fusion protein
MMTPKPKPEKALGEGESTSSDHDFLIVAIGASAGGLEAFSELIRSVPADIGMAFVLIQHLDPKHHSLLTELLSKETSMHVVEVRDGMAINPNHVYVIPPNTTMSVADRTLRLTPREDTRGVHMTVDSFMRSLAEDQGANCIGIILSGSGSDGTLGLTEIQAQGGVTFAQDETTAKHDGMPRSSIASGAVDFVLPPKGIAHELVRIARHPLVRRARVERPAELVPEEHAGLTAIFTALRKSTGVDFTYYRDTTIRRRIQRRMVVHKIEQLEDYVKYLNQDPGEVKALYQDMLINVTSFFRNPRVFEAIKTQVFPQVMHRRPKDSFVRIWTPGCASGEETYSLAICLLEFLGDKAAGVPIQLFGSDVSEANITKARAGIYPENIAGDVSPERLRRFFTKVEGGYRISKSIRDMCIFAAHNIISDPPFSQMDLISCRNLLIYLEPVLQKKVISLFHYALRSTGFLVLGTSEGVGIATNLFAIHDRSHKIFAKKAAAARPAVAFAVDRLPGSYAAASAGHGAKEHSDTNLNYVEAQKDFDRRLLTQFSPAAVFVDADLDVVHSRGNLDRYLKLAPGRASLNLLKMAREGLLFELRSALNRSKKEGVAVRKEGIQIKDGNGKGNNQLREVSLEVVPVKVGQLKDTHYMVVFDDNEAPPSHPSRRSTPTAAANQATRRRVEKLEQELVATKEYLHSVIESQEATNEELQSANEEILSSNEELQSTNEELETAKEELQSTNEELSTVNDELRNRNVEITLANNDLTNLLESINFGIVMLTNDLTIRRFTPPAQKVFGLIPADVGRPIANLNATLGGVDLHALIAEVMEKLKPVETETGHGGKQYLLQILPYRTAENRIDGIVITVLDKNLRDTTVPRQDAARPHTDARSAAASDSRGDDD